METRCPGPEGRLRGQPCWRLAGADSRAQPCFSGARTASLLRSGCVLATFRPGFDPGLAADDDGSDGEQDGEASQGKGQDQPIGDPLLTLAASQLGGDRHPDR